MDKGYRTDLAYIHDAGFGDLARSAAKFLLQRLELRENQHGTVVDLGCGSGIAARLIRDAGFDVVGIDVSAAMIEIARARVPEGEFRIGSWVTATIPPCVAVTAIGEVLSYTGSDRSSGTPSPVPLDRARRSAARAALMRRVHSALAPGGWLLFDMAGPSRTPASGRHRVFTEGPDWAVLMEAEADEARSFLTRRITTFRSVGELYRRDAEIHRLELVDPADVSRQVRDAGFSVQVLDGYGPQGELSGLAVFLATKAPTG